MIPAEVRRLAERDVARRYPEADAELRAELVDDLIADWKREDEAERLDAGCRLEDEGLENCDDAGTGEGRFHGRF